MEIDLTNNSLPVYEALANETRLKIMNLISERELNMSELAESLKISNAMVSKHIKKLEEAQLITIERRSGKSGVQKIIQLTVDDIHVAFPSKVFPTLRVYKNEIRPGLFTDFEVEPTCGLASVDHIIGKLDEPSYFFSENRVDASLVWFSEGFIEYKLPNPLLEKDCPEMLELSLELSSEFPVSNNVWPSDISFYINDVKVGMYTVPGNFSDVRGKLTPSWWNDTNSQYGLLKHLRVTKFDTNIDGVHLSDKTIRELKLKTNPIIKIRLAVEDTSEYVGGLTIFGKGFGNHPQDILLNLYYAESI